MLNKWNGRSNTKSIHFFELSEQYNRLDVISYRASERTVADGDFYTNKKYLSRIYGLPGDTLQIKEGKVYINRVKIELPPTIKKPYKLVVYPDFDRGLLSKFDTLDFGSNNIMVFTTSDKVSEIKNFPNIKKTEPYLTKEPDDRMIIPAWNLDNFGPVYIPRKGDMISSLNPIQASITGIMESQEATDDYYFLIGDNWAFTWDSRNYGLVPKSSFLRKMKW